MQACPSPSDIVGLKPERWVEATWDLLFMSSTTAEPFSTLADRLGFDPDTARAILDRAQRIQQIKEKRGKQSKRHRMESVAVDRLFPDTKQELACPWFPKSGDEQKIIEDLESRLGRLATGDPAKTRTVLGYYVNHLWLTCNLLLFRNPNKPNDARRYKDFLNDLGIPGDQVRLAFSDPRKRSGFRSKWKQALKLTWRHRDRIETVRPPFRTNSASDRRCAIEPDFRGNDPEEPSRGSDGFRFLMVMAAIRFGCEDE
jgi:hypothetical protein